MKLLLNLLLEVQSMYQGLAMNSKYKESRLSLYLE